jgi:membrane-associated protein
VSHSGADVAPPAVDVQAFDCRLHPSREEDLVRIAAAASTLNVLDPQSLLANLGTLGVFLVLFAETGLLIGFFLPGDSLLFTAGLLCTTSTTSTVHLSLPAVLVAAGVGALIGAQVGYFIGLRAGPALLDRPDRPRLQEGVARSRAALNRYGTAKAIVLARFIPLVRTALNPMAGTIRVPLAVFTVWQVVGGLLWCVGVTVAGYVLGQRIPNIDTYLLPIVALIVMLSLIPVALEVLRAGRRSREPDSAR